MTISICSSSSIRGVLSTFLCLIVCIVSTGPAHSDDISVLEQPDTTARNDHYVSNRAPLLPSRWIELPAGTVRPAGWLKVYLERQRDGLTGQLGNISAWLQKEDNAWLSRDGKGKYGWEELPYWLKGYSEIGYLLDEEEMLAETKVWIEGTLRSQRENGDFGPDQRRGDGTRDYWANMLMLFCLQTHYECTEDQRVLDLMTRYFHYQLTVPDDEFLTGYWQRMRGGDNIFSVYWLYNRTGDKKLLELATKLHRNTADWTQPNTLPNWHNVNVAQAFGEPATYFLQSHDPSHLRAAYLNFQEIRRRYGQVPGGMFGGDENCRPGYDDPRQAVETCGLVEQMLSDETLLRITGDAFWADHCEEVAFNQYPAAVMPDFRSLRYLTAPNMVVSDGKNHHPGIDNNGPFLIMNPFSSRCCQHNHSHGWPYFCKSLWMASPDNGVCAAMYAANEATMKVGDGTKVTWIMETNYPFEDQVRLKLRTPKLVDFPLYLRIPGWCDGATISINGERQAIDTKPETYVRIQRQWNSNDTVTLNLPMELKVRRWKHNHNSASIDYGPLTYSLKIGENYIVRDSQETAIGDSQWQKGADPSQWPSYEIHPTTPWNYGLVLPQELDTETLRIIKKPWPKDNFPWTIDSSPIEIATKGKRIPNWKIDADELCAVLQDSPVQSEEPTEAITLVPMGTARLRISSFPVIGDGTDAKKWVAPEKTPLTASHAHDFIGAATDGKIPKSSDDHEIPRFTWWDHKSSAEWLAREFSEPRKISSVEVYWFDDTGIGECRTPQKWTLSYRNGNKWEPVLAKGEYGTMADRFNRVDFEPIETTALRIDVKLREGFSGGVLEWRVKQTGL